MATHSLGPGSPACTPTTLALVTARPKPRVGVYIDYRFRETDHGRSAERAFALFLFALEPHVGSLTLIGRLDPSPEPYPYALPPSVRLIGLPFYATLTRPWAAAPAIARGARQAWRALDEVDALWALGPNPMSVLIALLGLVRGRRVVLGVRQDSARYVRRRHPHRRALWLAADALQGAYRLLARRCPVAVVGDELAAQFAGGREVLTFVVSLVPEADVASPRPERAFGRRVLSVGRLDAEKNPGLLLDVADLLRDDEGEPWRLEVVGSGPLESQLAQEVARRGLDEVVRLRGYLALDCGLVDAYRAADAFLHVSWTEGMPQVLIESFAAGLPTVATAVGGVAAFAGGAALLIHPGDAAAAADALRRLDRDAGLRRRLVEAGAEVARAHTLEAEAARVAALLAGGAG